MSYMVLKKKLLLKKHAPGSCPKQRFLRALQNEAYTVNIKLAN
jgi:hypothetical protein